MGAIKLNSVAVLVILLRVASTSAWSGSGFGTQDSSSSASSLGRSSRELFFPQFTVLQVIDFGFPGLFDSAINF